MIPYMYNEKMDIGNSINEEIQKNTLWSVDREIECYMENTINKSDSGKHNGKITIQ